MKFKHLFGPVPSRRLGISLGIDLIPYKTCTLDCIYCECRKTTNLTIDRKEYIPTGEILNELNEYLKNSPELDYITFAGSGEPTLHSKIGEIINFIKQNYPQYKVAVLTNGTLFYEKELRDELKFADLIIPSLDAASDEVFKKINRPHENLNLSKIINGIAAFRKDFPGEIWIEVFIVPGINDTKNELQKIKKVIEKINPEKIQLNTLDRPGAESWVVPAGEEQIEKIASFLSYRKVRSTIKNIANDSEAYFLNAEIIAKFTSRKKIKSFKEDIEENIIKTLRRRPCTAEDISKLLGIHLNEVNKYVQALLESGKIREEKEDRGVFFRVK
ncbi:MAG: radical SAM protein [Candidatus Altiarchaeales archaeon HGW-Altiarchaeales-3]|nr:MAG: radical SAM protein [Candidatus Altiarchaeales archaeon HGW-Altiarchaeales-3]